MPKGLHRIRGILSSHVSAIKISFRDLALTPIATSITIVTIGICLALPMSLFLFIKNIQHFSQGWDRGCALTLYVDAKLASHEISSLVEKVEQYRFVEKTLTLSPKDALAEFEETSGLKDTLVLLPENPLPAVISVQLNTKEAPYEELLAMKDSLAKLPGVNQVSFDYAWVEKLNGFLSFGKSLSHCLYLIIGLGVVLMVGNMIRLALSRHHDEIEVLSLIGATKAFIRRPFLYRGVLYGALSGFVAVLISSLAIHFLKPSAQHLITLFSGMFSLETLRLYDTLGFLTASAMLGWLGSAIAFAQQKRAFASDPIE